MENDENIKLYCFGSGSSGNCYYLKKGKSGIIIDIGISHRKLKKFFSDYGLAMADIRGILVSHSHTDHVRAVGAFSSAMRIPVYTTQQVHEGMERNFLMTKKILKDDKIIVNYHSKFQIGDTEIIAFPVPHDSNGNNGYLLKFGDATLCFLTDVGAVTQDIIQYVSQAEYLILEANYDREMLQNGPYSDFLKRRIQSGSGHLCNELAGQLIAKHSSSKIRKIWFCHLSEENNHPDLVVKTIKEIIANSGRKELIEVPLIPLRRKTPQCFEL